MFPTSPYWSSWRENDRLTTTIIIIIFRCTFLMLFVLCVEIMIVNTALIKEFLTTLFIQNGKLGDISSPFWSNLFMSVALQWTKRILRTCTHFEKYLVADTQKQYNVSWMICFMIIKEPNFYFLVIPAFHSSIRCLSSGLGFSMAAVSGARLNGSHLSLQKHRTELVWTTHHHSWMHNLWTTFPYKKAGL